jgi:anti-anti-sigma regulatory factor
MGKNTASRQSGVFPAGFAGSDPLRAELSRQSGPVGSIWPLIPLFPSSFERVPIPALRLGTVVGPGWAAVNSAWLAAAGVLIGAGIIVGIAALPLTIAFASVSAITREFDESDDEGEGDPNTVRRRTVPPGVEVYEINGPSFFGAAEKFKETMTGIHRMPRVPILRMRNVPAVDSTGLNALRDVIARFRRGGARVILSDVHAQPMVALRRSALSDELPEEDLVGNIDDALNVARAHLGLAPAPRPDFAVPTVAREQARGSSVQPPEAR